MHDRVTFLPACPLQYLRHVTELNLSYNTLISLPHEIRELHQLVKLVARSLVFLLFPIFHSLSSLQCHSLCQSCVALLTPHSNNAIKTLPESIGLLTQLKGSHFPHPIHAIVDNEIEFFRTCVTVSPVVNLRNNKLVNLPFSFGALQQLRVLELDHNRFPIVPLQLAGARSYSHELISFIFAVGLSPQWVSAPHALIHHSSHQSRHSLSE